MALNPKYDLLTVFRDDTQAHESLSLEDIGIASGNSAEIGEALADSDKILVTNASASDIPRSSLMSRVATYITSKLPIIGGTFTPTLGVSAPIAVTGNKQGMYLRVGSYVVFAVALFGVTRSGAAGDAYIEFSLPVASNFAAGSDLIGVVTAMRANGTSAASSGYLYAEPTGNVGYLYTRIETVTVTHDLAGFGIYKII